MGLLANIGNDLCFLCKAIRVVKYPFAVLLPCPVCATIATKGYATQ